ncbi:hypothetical protein FQZ97_1149560 [compost metagenome]
MVSTLRYCRSLLPGRSAVSTLDPSLVGSIRRNGSGSREASPNCRLSRMAARRSAGMLRVVMNRQEGKLVISTMPRRSVT